MTTERTEVTEEGTTKDANHTKVETSGATGLWPVPRGNEGLLVPSDMTYRTAGDVTHQPRASRECKEHWRNASGTRRRASKVYAIYEFERDHVVTLKWRNGAKRYPNQISGWKEHQVYKLRKLDE